MIRDVLLLPAQLYHTYEGIEMTIAPNKTGYASVNGLELYYEIYGSGHPVVLLHGGLGTIGMFSEKFRSSLAESRAVVGVELQGHGHTGDVDRPMRFEMMADDVVALLHHLGHQSADVIGYSLGGGVALQTAIRHPEVVRRLVLISAPCKRVGWYPEVLAGMASMNAEAARSMVGSPPHQAYVRAAPNPEGWPLLVEKLSELLRQDYDWSTALSAITAPTLLVVGDADSVSPQHAVDMFRLLGGGIKDVGFGSPPPSQLAVLPGTTHFSVLDRTDQLLSIISSFLDPGT